MSYEDRMDARSDHNAEQKAEGFCEGFQKAKELIRAQVRDGMLLVPLKAQWIIEGLIEFIDELEEE